VEVSIAVRELADHRLIVILPAARLRTRLAATQQIRQTHAARGF